MVSFYNTQRDDQPILKKGVRDRHPCETRAEYHLHRFDDLRGIKNHAGLCGFWDKLFGGLDKLEESEVGKRSLAGKEEAQRTSNALRTLIQITDNYLRELWGWSKNAL